jgi:hypothetical protein
MNNFVEGIKIYNKLVFSTDINYLSDNKVIIMCHDFTLKPLHCKICDKLLTTEQYNKLKDLGFTVIDNKCCLSYIFN